MTMRSYIVWPLLLSFCGAFVLPGFVFPLTPTRRWLMMAPQQKDDVDALKKDIEDMKAEAVRRMQALQTNLASSLALNTTDDSISQEPASAVKEDRRNEEEAFKPRVAVSNAPRKDAVKRDEQSHLDGTCWKVMLNIGREQGTWMPKTWGASGERLLLNAEVEFTSDQLYEREEFLAGMANAKTLRVLSLEMGPTMTEDSRPVRALETGGWRVAPGEGPKFTDVLRFYIEVEEAVQHQGGDVYCPKGRVYCTCGYFPIHDRSNGMRAALKSEQDRLSARFENLESEMEVASLWDKLKLGKELWDVRTELGKVAQQMEEVRVREPEKALLRLSRRGDIGLTKEGGVCCKVVKGLATEYHILGKFGLASIEKRQERDEKTLKP